ncbi:MAG: hypothetical protein AAF939_21975 [Planctomycetota bacterium]
MFTFKNLLNTSLVIATLITCVPDEANADGPLRRWIRGVFGQNNTAPYGYYQPTGQTTANFAPNAYNLQPGQCMRTCEQTCNRTVVNYVPYTAYRTAYKRVPVTQYRPVTNTDPCTGCTVTCMRPCTTYTYQCQRVPYTTYRPVYRTETYKVPVTTITNDCATGCGTCATCPTGTMAAPQNFAPTPAVPQPSTTTSYELPGSGTIVPNGSYNPTPADTAPSLGGGTDATQSGFQKVARREVPVYRTTAQIRPATNPIERKFQYSPVRMASNRSMESAIEDSRSVAPAAYVAPTNYVVRPDSTSRRATSFEDLNGWVEN